MELQEDDTLKRLGEALLDGVSRWEVYGVIGRGIAIAGIWLGLGMAIGMTGTAHPNLPGWVYQWVIVSAVIVTLPIVLPLIVPPAEK
jgi:hypothetical protein